MNCKPGDLAVIVRTSATRTEALGRIVRVTEIHSMDYEGRGPVWMFENSPITLQDGRQIDVVNDCGIRPIRLNEGDDETLTWAGKPEGVAA